MASDDTVRMKAKLWTVTPNSLKKQIKNHIEEFDSFDPNSFLTINHHVIGPDVKLYDCKLNLCQIVEAEDLCRTCGQAGTIDCPYEMTKKGEKSVAERILDLTRYNVELFTSLDETYARFSIGGHMEIHPISGRKFKEYLSYLIYQDEAKPPSSEAITNAKNVLSAKARFEGEDYTLHNRVAWQDDAIYFDLTNKTHEVVEITKEGWNILDATKIPLFKRYSHQKAAPIPVKVSNPMKVVHRILDYVNHDKNNDGMKLLILVSLITSFIPDIPHAVIIVFGDQGSAKTSFLRAFRNLIDPSDTDTMSFPRSKDLNQVLDHNWFCGFDNVGGIPKWLSDALCRAVTGDGNVTRQHYTNDDDFIRKYKRVIALNGINNVATAPDLLDRSVLFKLPRITGEDYRDEKRFWKDFENELPELLGAILSIISEAYKLYSTIEPSALFRLADWTIWGCAVAQALGYDPNEFLNAYAKNKAELTNEALVNSDIATALSEFIVNHESKFWKGTMSELLPLLVKEAEKLNISVKSKHWPKAPNALSRRLQPFAVPLKESGIRYEMVDKEHRIYEVQFVGGVGDIPRVPGPLEKFGITDDAQTISKPDTVSKKSTEKAEESTSDDTDDTDDILQNTDASIPPPQKEEKGSRGVEDYEARWKTFLERTSEYHVSYTFEIDELEKFYSEDERGQLQRDLMDWEKEGLVFRKKTKTKEGWRVADRGAPEKKGGSKKK